MENYVFLSLFQALLFFLIIANMKEVFSKDWKEALYVYGVLYTLPIFLVMVTINYSQMPVLRWWGFEYVWIETFFVSLIGFVIAYLLYRPDMDDWKVREKVKNLKPWSKEWFGFNPYWLRAIPLVITLIAPVVAAFQSLEIFNASKFVKRLNVEVYADTTFTNSLVADTSFNHVVVAVDVKKMITVDGELAKKVGGDVLGDNTGIASKVEVGTPTLQNLSGRFTINGNKELVFNDDLFWVAPLEHRDFIKYFINKTTPGYVLVDATNINNRYLVTEVNGKPLKLKYLESAVLNDDIERHIKINGYLHRGLNDHCFEIDPNGQPYWVLSSYEHTIGFAGEESEGPIIVNAQTGEITAYTIEDAPTWIDRIQPKDFIEEQVLQWGSLQNGWWNSCSFSKQENVMQPTPGMTLVYSNGRSYWYTGIKSASAKETTNGFMLIDTRTKAAKFYKASGFNETEAMNIAEGQAEASAAGYHATYPVLYNVRGVPTYFMTYKDATGNVQGYCFVASTSRDAVGCDKLKTKAAQKYADALKAIQHDKLYDSKVVSEEITATIKDIAYEEGTYYLLLNEKQGFEFTGNSSNFPELKWSKVGQKVKISFNIGEEKVVPLETFDNVEVEI